MYRPKGMKKGVLTAEHLRRVLRAMESTPGVDRRILLHPLHWEDCKKHFKLTNSQMDKLYIKETYIGTRDVKGEG